MSCKIQVTVDEKLNETLKLRAKELGLSVSSYARSVLMSVVSCQNSRLLDQAMADIQSDNIEALSLAKFNRQLDNL